MLKKTLQIQVQRFLRIELPSPTVRLVVSLVIRLVVSLVIRLVAAAQRLTASIELIAREHQRGDGHVDETQATSTRAAAHFI
jgi:hypothetical protein